ncbi:acyl-CoA N-acyltransferase [Mycotypha africana]|uniref:acyl-CoA N-acyltransferase n=1 Tax=Mycotypha africana TaxID=64632 RepID=UPI0023008469|nr:acyl-CoA N-acyltransferase [Mycotypha africana]KAI8982016.1 acyl-CoA N-acyltransferase [Mycotypha africana]
MVVSSIFVRKAVHTDLKYVEEATKVVNAAYRYGAETNTNTNLESSTKIVGTVLLQPSENPGEAEISLFSVLPSYQSKGIGSRLIRTVMAGMKDLGFHTAVIHVIESRSEILAWYKKLGFVETGERVPFVWPELLKQDNLHFLTLKRKLE